MDVLACVRGTLHGTLHGFGSGARVSCNSVVCLIQQCRKSKRSLSYACVTGEWQSCYVSFHECVRTSKIYVRDCTPVPPLAMLLFCKSTYRPRLVPPAQNVCRHACASCAFLSRLAVMSAVPTFAGRPCLPPSCFGSSLLASTLSSFDPSLLDPHRGAAAYGGMAWLTCRWR